MEISHALALATAGRQTVAHDWVPATALRAVISDDPCLTWLAAGHGKPFGFGKDKEEGSFLSWIGGMGAGFEAKWIAEMAPDAVRVNEEDTDVRDMEAVQRTLEAMRRRVPVITKAAVWLAELGVYGTCDLIALASWVRDRFPSLRELLADVDDRSDHYVVLDVKFQTELETTAKRKDLLLASSQVQLYSHIIGSLQGYFPTHAFLVTRDRILDPLPVPVRREEDGSLDSFLAEMLEEHRFITKYGRWMRPWKHGIVAPDWGNTKDAPWSGAKTQILEEFMTHTPLHILPRIGKKQARVLRESGIHSVEGLLSLLHEGKVDTSTLKALPGMGDAGARRLLAVLHANHTGSPTPVPVEAVPPQRRTEFFVDFEFLPSVHVDFEKQWPGLEGREMIFAIGCGWEQDGNWEYARFVADRETPKAERIMWQHFLRFLQNRGVQLTELRTDSNSDDTTQGETVLYCWSGAEQSQSRRAAERLGIKVLEHLPWYDLQKVFLGVPIALPGCWNFGLKSVVRALGECSPDHAVDYPADLCSGMEAMVLAWKAYEKTEPAETPEMRLVLEYLETDCKSLWQILRWLRIVRKVRNVWESAPICKAKMDHIQQQQTGGFTSELARTIK